jgi:uncharacterized membrane protein YsdA (DUF1294 family)
VFRHKSRKTALQSTFWDTVAFNVIALFFLASDTGRA